MSEKNISKCLESIYEICDDRYKYLGSSNLYEGKIGILIFLFHYARFVGSERIERESLRKLEIVWNNLDRAPSSIDFKYGIFGIAFGMDYLLRQGFLPNTSSSILDNLDVFLFERGALISETIGETSESFAHFIYFTNRLSSTIKSESVEQSKLLRWVMHTLVDSCEEIVESKRFDSENCFSSSFLLALIQFLKMVLGHEPGSIKTRSLIAKAFHKLDNFPENRFSVLDLFAFSNLTEEIPDSCAFNMLSRKRIAARCAKEIALNKKIFNGLARQCLVNGFVLNHNSGIKASFLISQPSIFPTEADISFENGLAGLGYFLISGSESNKRSYAC